MPATKVGGTSVPLLLFQGLKPRPFSLPTVRDEPTVRDAPEVKFLGLTPVSRDCNSTSLDDAWRPWRLRA